MVGRKKKGDYACFKPERKYNQHKVTARYRGILFRLTFEQWWSIWEKSGHWHERGKDRNYPGGGYVMARFGDKGAYEIGNVKIITQQENIQEGYDLRKSRSVKDKGLKSLEKNS